MFSFLESLESRQLFSGSVSLVIPGETASTFSVFQPLAVLQNVVGTWKGTLTLAGVHTKTVKVKIASQTHTGKVAGVLTTSLDPSIRVAVTGKVTTSGRLYLTLGGSHSGGSINGTGNGKLKLSTTKVTLAMTFTQNGADYSGTISLHKMV